MHRPFLERLYHTAVAAAHPSQCLPQHLPAPPASGRIIILAAGKAAGSMVEVAERHYLDDVGVPSSRIAGLAVTRRGYARPTRLIRVVEAGHPVPDAAGLAATLETLTLADTAGPDDLVLALISGGASANWIAPTTDLSLAEKQALTKSLLACGASITEINTVRKHLSRIKGGRLAARAQPARLVSIAISDVPGDDPAVIGSGPTVPDPSTLADARAIVARYHLTVPATVTQALADPTNESPKPGNPLFDDTAFVFAARPADVFKSVEAAVHAAGYECVQLGTALEGEARAVAAEHARIALDLKAQARRAVVLSGGELTVTVPGIAGLAADTDGTDGGVGSPDDPAGAYVDHTTLRRAHELGLDPAAFLADNNSTKFFAGVDNLLRPGATHTNVNDFRAIVVDGSR
jgi:glycerate 2-kinase